MSKNFYTQLLNNFSQLFESGKNSDLILYVGYKHDIKVFKVHTQILCAQSTYFQAALSKKLFKKEDDCYVFEKTNVEADVFEIILRYLYTGEANIGNCDGFQILKLLVASDELNLSDLLQFAQSYLIESRKSFLIEQPVRVLESIFRLESCEMLRLFCIDAICDGGTKLFDSDIYLTLEEDIFAQILQQDKLHIKEVALWKGVLKWGVSRHPELKNPPTEWSTDDVNRMKKTLAGLIKHIRFFTISADEYYDEVRPYKKLFSKKLREEMLQFIMPPSRKPEDIMAKTRGRLLDSGLVDYPIMALIAGWVDSMNTAYDEIPYEFTLIYRASRDGFDNQKFRNMCSSKGPTVVIAKVMNHPNIFGGYNPSDWSAYNSVGSPSCNYTSNGFIFEMPDGKSTAGARIGRLNRGDNRYCHSHYGPSFGNFYINGQAWNSNISKRNIYRSSSHMTLYGNKRARCSNRIACSIASGTLEEYEVFTIKKKD
ncbi:6984_t:CDS:2 [Paraglomus brasilianum]|uniref:6984_t:CDS:1 n=1 Tax=Paraglomus brasilianum TaxID=144538 RepID=A0A9N9E0U9_9GLOM|nr:6984_t:CDS:2 [Paraglomus brasilianum]